MNNATLRKELYGEIKAHEREIQKFKAKMPKAQQCIHLTGTEMCYEDATWVRCTQFSGNHFLCDAHAKAQSDFGKEDPSYFFWITMEEYKEDEAAAQA